MSETQSDDRPSVLVVCTGNLCRSPAAEAMLKDRLGSRAWISSAGTRAPLGARMPRDTRRALANIGLNVGRRHRARPLTAKMIASATLIIGIEEHHRDYASQLAPLDAERIVTLGELEAAARRSYPIDGDTVGERLASAAHAATHARTAVDPQELRSVADPYGKGSRAAMLAVAEISDAVSQVATWALPASHTPLEEPVAHHEGGAAG